MTKYHEKPRKWRGWITVSAFDGSIVEFRESRPVYRDGWKRVEIVEIVRPKRRSKKP